MDRRRRGTYARPVGEAVRTIVIFHLELGQGGYDAQRNG
jgi:hypothetical protein